MNKRDATIQFFKDGLAGLVTVGLIYAFFWLPKIFPDDALPRIIVKIVDKLGFIHLALMVFFITNLLSVFISTGINGRFIEKDIVRSDWVKPILKMLGVSWLVTVSVTQLKFLSFRIIDAMDRDHIGFFQALPNIFSGLLEPDVVDFTFYTFISGGIIGLLLGFTAAYFATILFKPQKRSTRMIILIIASICMVFSAIAFGWLFTLSIYPARWGTSFGFLLLRSAL